MADWAIRERGGKIALFVICLLPFFGLLTDTFRGHLGANPIETLHFRTGDWTLRFLCLTLALRPARVLSGKTWIMRLFLIWEKN